MFDKKKYAHEYYENHKEEIKLRIKNYEKSQIIPQYERRKKYLRKYEHEHHGRRSGYAKEYYKRKRDEIISLLGGKCIRCGEIDWRCLQIDHINGGGQKERKSFSCPSQFQRFIYKQIKSGSKEYQILCANCNWKKRWERGE